MKRLTALLFTLLAIPAAAVAIPAAAIPAAAQASTASCAVDYAVTAQWSGFFEAEITVSFTGLPAQDGWTLAFDFVSAGQRVVSAGNGMWSQSGRHVVVTSGPFSTVLPSGGSMSLGFIGSYVTVNPAPVNFVFNGIPCTEVTPVASSSR